MKRKTSAYMIAVKYKGRIVNIPVETKKIRGNAQLSRAERIADRIVRKHRLQAVFQR